MPEVRGLTREMLAESLRVVGLASGDSVIVHSSFRSIGMVDGGPETVIDSLLDAIAPVGNLMLPTFNYTANIAQPHFDPAVTPCLTGVIPELGRKRPDAVRSLQPTHSVVVIGPDADELTRDHMAYRAVGLGSPIDRLAKMGGKVLLLGVGHTSSTTVHVGEEYAGVPKEGWTEVRPYAKVLMPDGSIGEYQIDTSTSCSTGFDSVEYALRRSGHIRDGYVGRARVKLMLGRDVIDRVREMIAEKPDVLMCTDPGCRPCTGARRNLRELGRI
jgi:aminoglycoside 3-N-acetyltransferase